MLVHFRNSNSGKKYLIAQIMVNPLAVITNSKLYKIDPFCYTGSVLISTKDLLYQARMEKGKIGNHKETGRGKKLQKTQTIGSSKIGRKCKTKILKNIADIYDSGNLIHI